jgi:hypothetical protein
MEHIILTAGGSQLVVPVIAALEEVFVAQNLEVFLLR